MGLIDYQSKMSLLIINLKWLYRLSKYRGLIDYQPKGVS